MSRYKNFLMEASFSDEIKKAVWEKGATATDRATKKEIPNRRFDVVGAIMHEEEYGNRGSEFIESKFGWEIDHIDNDTSNNDIANLRPLFWRNNTARNAKENYTFYKFDDKKQDNSIEVQQDKDI